MIKKFLVVGFLCCLLFLLSACEESASLQSPTPSSFASIAPLTSPSPQKVALSPESTATTPPIVPAAGSEHPLMFREKLATISIGEQDAGSGRTIASWRGASFPEAESLVVHHWQEASINLNFEEASEEETLALMNRITVDGEKGDWKRDERHPNQFRLVRAQELGSSFELRMDDLPPLKISHMAPMTYKAVTPKGEADPNALVIRAYEYGNRVMVPLEENSVTLEFSEPMKPVLPTASDEKTTSFKAEWLSTTRLRIELGELGYPTDGMKQVLVQTDMLEAVSGNTLDTEGQLHILRAPKVLWREGETGADVNQGPRDRYYEQLIFSPDRHQYVGVVSLGSSLGDGDGWSYAFVVERPGELPTVVENVFYSTIEPNGAPIRWIHPGMLLYSSYYGVYTYDTKKMTRNQIVAADYEERDIINFAEWDFDRSLLYVIAFENRYEMERTRKISLLLDGTQVQVEPNFSDVVLAGKYSYLDLIVTPTEGGVYWTRTEEGIPITDFVTKDGRTLTIPGVVRAVGTQGVYLQQYSMEPVDRAERLPILHPEGWVYWEPGKPEQRIADLPEPGIVFVWGHNLMSRIEDERYYRFDRALNRWVDWQEEIGEPNAEPVRGLEGLYRIRNKQ